MLLVDILPAIELLADGPRFYSYTIYIYLANSTSESQRRLVGLLSEVKEGRIRMRSPKGHPRLGGIFESIIFLYQAERIR